MTKIKLTEKLLLEKWTAQPFRTIFGFLTRRALIIDKRDIVVTYFSLSNFSDIIGLNQDFYLIPDRNISNKHSTLDKAKNDFMDLGRLIYLRCHF